jgi:predicted acylesterase/phospholipase RssA
VSLTGLSKEDAIEILSQSAAIPELFRQRFILGGIWVDGGRADNTPILAVADENPEIVFVVYLDSATAHAS